MSRFSNKIRYLNHNFKHNHRRNIQKHYCLCGLVLFQMTVSRDLFSIIINQQILFKSRRWLFQFETQYKRIRKKLIQRCTRKKPEKVNLFAVNCSFFLQMIKQKCLKTIKMISTRFKQWWHPIYVSSLILWFHVLKLNTKYSFLSMCVFEMLLSNQNKIRCRIYRTYEPLFIKSHKQTLAHKNTKFE